MTEQELLPLDKANKPKFFYGYVIVIATFCLQLIAFGTLLTTGVFLNHIVAEFGWLRATISGAYSLAFVLMGFSYIIGGALNDRFGPRVVVATCAFLFGLGHLLLSQMNTTWQLYLFYCFIGIGIGAVDVVPLATLARWFTKRRGVMTAIAKVGIGTGIFLVPMLASWLISAYGWRISYIVLGTLILAGCIPLSQLLQRDPSKKNLLPDGNSRPNNNSPGIVEPGLTVREAVRTWQLWVLCAAYMTGVFCMQTVTVHIVPHAKSLGFPHIQSDRLVSVIGGASIAGRLVMGFVGDRIGNRRAMVICFLVLVTALAWVQYAGELWALYLFVAIYGFYHGGVVTVISPAVAELFGTRSQGSLLGMVMSIGVTISAAGPLLAGYIFDVSGSYQLAFLILLGFAVTGLILSSLLRPIKKGGTDE